MLTVLCYGPYCGTLTLALMDGEMALDTACLETILIQMQMYAIL